MADIQVKRGTVRMAEGGIVEEFLDDNCVIGLFNEGDMEIALGYAEGTAEKLGLPYEGTDNWWWGEPGVGVVHAVWIEGGPE